MINVSGVKEDVLLGSDESRPDRNKNSCVVNLEIYGFNCVFRNNYLVNSILNLPINIIPLEV